jgi:SNF2-related domain
MLRVHASPTYAPSLLACQELNVHSECISTAAQSKVSCCSSCFKAKSTCSLEGLWHTGVSMLCRLLQYQMVICACESCYRSKHLQRLLCNGDSCLSWGPWLITDHCLHCLCTACSMPLNLLDALTRAMAADEALKPRFRELRQLIAAASTNDDDDMDEETDEDVERVRNTVAAEIETELCPHQLLFVKGAAASESAALACAPSQDTIFGGCSAGTKITVQRLSACRLDVICVWCSRKFSMLLLLFLCCAADDRGTGKTLAILALAVASPHQHWPFSVWPENKCRDMWPALTAAPQRDPDCATDCFCGNVCKATDSHRVCSNCNAMVHTQCWTSTTAAIAGRDIACLSCMMLAASTQLVQNGTTLVIVPTTLIVQWQDQIDEHWHDVLNDHNAVVYPGMAWIVARLRSRSPERLQALKYLLPGYLGR